MVGRKNFVLLKKINILIRGLYSILLFQSFPTTVSMLKTELRTGRYPLPSSLGSSIPLYLHMTVGYDLDAKTTYFLLESRIMHHASFDAPHVLPDQWSWFTSGLRRSRDLNVPTIRPPRSTFFWNQGSCTMHPSRSTVLVYFRTLAFGRSERSNNLSSRVLSPGVKDCVPASFPINDPGLLQDFDIWDIRMFQQSVLQEYFLPESRIVRHASFPINGPGVFQHRADHNLDLMV
jgi:hypothetical protein